MGGDLFLMLCGLVVLDNWFVGYFLVFWVLGGLDWFGVGGGWGFG